MTTMVRQPWRRVGRTQRLCPMASCDVLTDARVSRMSMRLPYEKKGSPAYVRGTIEEWAGLADEQAAPVREDRIAGVRARDDREENMGRMCAMAAPAPEGAPLPRADPQNLARAEKHQDTTTRGEAATAAICSVATSAENGESASRRDCSLRALLRRFDCFLDDDTMGDIGYSHGGAAGATFPIAMYVLFLSYLALLLVPCSDLMHVLSLMYLVKQFSPSGFAAALKPSPFTGSHFKRWQNKTLLWLTSMGVHRVAEGTPRGPLTPEEDKAFGDATVIFVGAVLSVLGDKLVDAYLHIRNGKELWDALDAKFGAADAGGELYAMEQFNDYRMVENRSVVEQAHEIQIMAKELELLKCVLPDKFVAGCIVAKLPPSWRNFATSLKHQRHEFSVENIMGSLDVEEKARAKDKHTGGTEGRSAANMVQKNAHKSKGKNKGVSQTTNFKKKGKTEKKDPCWVCGETGHWANRCPQRKGKKCQAGQNSTSVNMVIGNTEEGTTGHEVPQ
ncbi:hypothetical protein QYE76_068845 [Lolium multiflorum]|uniref:CCHC-type domain-containing protein n=1 Tax=Lolium multiflorum TaxID=4521 RepID=A0AAD8SF70_LOLMU|nr:hypothetical protein QYE76_068845 [Lolium multiflorum]